MDASSAPKGGSKPVWLALTAAAAILGLAITVALPGGGTARSSARLSAETELRGMVGPWAAVSSAQADGSEGAGGGAAGLPAVDAPGESAQRTSAKPEGAEGKAPQEPEGELDEEQLREQELSEARSLVKEKFELLRKSDPRAAQLLLEALGQGLAEDPEVALMQSERAAIATLKNISSAQAQMQASGAIDVDTDGVGEYGTFAELSGGCTLRGTTNTMNPPVLSAAFRRVQRGVVERSGYFFAMFLPDATGEGLEESYEGGAHIALFQAVAADTCERSWCAYAWPVSSQTAGRVFFVNQSGDVLARENGTAGELVYAGADGPRADAAFDATTMPGTILGTPAHSTPSRDGGRWLVVN